MNKNVLQRKTGKKHIIGGLVGLTVADTSILIYKSLIIRAYPNYLYSFVFLLLNTYDLLNVFIIYLFTDIC